jgi:hypothetical protein
MILFGIDIALFSLEQKFSVTLPINPTKSNHGMENHGSIWESGVTKLKLNELDDGGFISR